MKFFLMIASFLIGNAGMLFKAPTTAFSQQIVLNVRALVVVILSSIGALALFCSGIFMFISHIAAQMDSGNEVRITATAVLSLLLTLISLGVLFYSLRRRTWLRATGFQEVEPAAKNTSAVETAIASLIMDYVKERETRRHHPKPE